MKVEYKYPLLLEKDYNVLFKNFLKINFEVKEVKEKYVLIKFGFGKSTRINEKINKYAFLLQLHSMYNFNDTAAPFFKNKYFYIYYKNYNKDLNSIKKFLHDMIKYYIDIFKKWKDISQTINSIINLLQKEINKNKSIIKEYALLNEPSKYIILSNKSTYYLFVEILMLNTDLSSIKIVCTLNANLDYIIMENMDKVYKLKHKGSGKVVFDIYINKKNNKDIVSTGSQYYKNIYQVYKYRKKIVKKAVKHLKQSHFDLIDDFLPYMEEIKKGEENNKEVTII